MDFAYFLIVLVAIAINVAFAMYAGGIAEQKGYSKGNWIAVCIIFGIIGYILIAALPDLELRAALENIEKKLAKDKNDNYLPRSSSSNRNSSNSNSTMKSLSEMKPLAPLSDSMDYWTCKSCGLENPKEARYCQHCGGYR
ncbi:MAG: hypothetical protein BHW29_07680 [Faecalibacterium sp. CAG:74_58_120]|nr:MAG: hypothetical protein BHW29_07680 [Faecalibacterium sp. CAG:74_58_120]